MAFAYLTRVVTFPAVHRYRRPDWSEAQNRAAYGGVADEHAHDYRCEVTVRGPVDATTGMIVDLGVLDRILADEVLQRFSGKRIHLDVPEFTMRLPTGEALAMDIWERVSRRLPGVVTLERVRVAEDDTLWSEYRGE